MTNNDSLPVEILAGDRLGDALPLFREVFGHDLGEDMLQWKYGHGRGLSFAVRDEDERVVAHCGVFYRQVLLDGRSWRACQLGDLMASPAKPGGLSRQASPFYRLIDVLLDRLPCGENEPALAFGFPSDRAMRLGERLGLFTTVDELQELLLAPRQPGRLADTLEPVAVFDASRRASLDRLWQAMQKDFAGGPIGVRDADYMEGRYLSHPRHRYRLYLVRSRLWRRLIGAFILRLDGDLPEIMDVVAPRRDIGRVLRACQCAAYSEGKPLRLWLTRGHAKAYAAMALSCQPLQFRIMGNPRSPEATLAACRGKWWLTSGDTDYR